MPKRSDLKIGRIISKLGNEVVASFPDSGIPKNLKTVAGLYGVRISLGDSGRGKVFDIIGRVENPYLVVKLSRK